MNIKQLFIKYKEMIMYIIIGGCTTVVSLATYFLFHDLLHIHYQVSNILSWICAVLFAYITNKKYVFESKYSGFRNSLMEIGKFLSSRLASLGVEIISMYFFVQVCRLDDGLVKLMNQFIVLVLNYIFSKFWVFRKNR